LQIGVADAGIGIKESLKTRYPSAGRWTHQEAILKALKKDFSRFPKRGLGLYMVQRIVEDFKGHLHLRSGDSRVFFGTTQRGFSVEWFPGVQANGNLACP
jgi:sensor histidine kinase regulating citrate/malate metabolism